MVSSFWKLGESKYHSFTSFLIETIISIDYSEDLRLERMIVIPLETRKKVWRNFG